jgi:putative transposase
MLLMLFLSLITQLQWIACSGHGDHSLMNQIRHAVAHLRAVLLALAIRLHLRESPRYYRQVAVSGLVVEAGAVYRTRAKPEWVKNEVLRLKALMPHTGCRKIADCFNRRFAEARLMTVGKTYVADTLRKYHYELAILRRKIKNAKPKAVPKNLIWALDLTGKTTLDGRTQMILGIIEHGSRAALALEAVHSKSSWSLLGKLAAAIKRYGKPKIIRTDNEAIFTSRVFRLALFLLGIRHQTTDLHCPWQNGRVERFFGTLKSSLDQLAVTSFDALNSALGEFRFFYNHVRSHQNLAGATPAEAWAGMNPHTTKFKREYWFEAWDGLLAGYYLRR